LFELNGDGDDGGGGKSKTVGLISEFQPDDENLLHGDVDGDEGEDEEEAATDDDLLPKSDDSIITFVSIGLKKTDKKRDGFISEWK
jgi:hypothetical protein